MKRAALYFCGERPPINLAKGREALVCRAARPCMNKLFVGFTKEIALPRAGLLIDDEVREIPRSRIFGAASF
jgi:hypothetical protein